ncbi:hypothetical protein N7540_005439 [Penicillium herquei]|nr:hypothetical protein N7540_005439 [Penicillium herquei]
MEGDQDNHSSQIRASQTTSPSRFSKFCSWLKNWKPSEVLSIILSLAAILLSAASLITTKDQNKRSMMETLWEDCQRSTVSAGLGLHETTNDSYFAQIGPEYDQNMPMAG